jgi:hypothetical protein
MKANTLSRCPDFDTENMANNHLIVLPLDQFKGMPESVTKMLGALSQSNSTSKFTLGATEIEEPTIESGSLDAKVKLYQDEHYQSLLTWKDMHGLRLDGQNYLWKGDALIVVENNNLRRGILHQFHTLKTAGHPGITKTMQMIQPHYWWPHMKDFISAYVKGCAACQMNKINTHPTRPPLFPITSSSNLPFQTTVLQLISSQNCPYPMGMTPS